MIFRFLKTTAQAIGEEVEPGFQWWLDTGRAYSKMSSNELRYVAVEEGKDPNNFVRHEKMQLLFNDQAEYYFVCDDCHFIHRDRQFSGSTRGASGWQERADKALKQHIEKKGWCEFCDPIFGNGGWCI